MIEKVIEARSSFTGKLNRMRLAARAEQWKAFEDGELVQVAFPHMTAAEREFLLTGTTQEEWDAFLGPENEADE